MSEIEDFYGAFYGHVNTCPKCCKAPVGLPADDCPEGQRVYEPIGQYEAENDI